MPETNISENECHALAFNARLPDIPARTNFNAINNRLTPMVIMRAFSFLFKYTGNLLLTFFF